MLYYQHQIHCGLLYCTTFDGFFFKLRIILTLSLILFFQEVVVQVLEMDEVIRVLMCMQMHALCAHVQHTCMYMYIHSVCNRCPILYCCDDLSSLP